MQKAVESFNVKKKQIQNMVEQFSHNHEHKIQFNNKYLNIYEYFRGIIVYIYIMF